MKREAQANVTILSGDLNADDDAGSGIDENSYHVVMARFDLEVVREWPGPSAVLDGFTITGGNADGVDGSLQNYGGGLFNLSGAPTVRNCVFVRNTAHWGGGMLHYITTLGRPTVTDCLFTENTAWAGGALANRDATTEMVRCQFVGNSVTNYGGAIFSNGLDYNTPDATPTLTDCLMSQNSSGRDGGAIYNTSISMTLRNVTISSNTAANRSGGLYGLWQTWTISNSILWKNQDSNGEIESSQIRPVYYADPFVISYTLIQGLDLYGSGAGNIAQDPLFVSNDDLRLGAGSPAINAGDPNTVRAVDETDLDGAGRVQSGRIDMGAYEADAPLN